MQGERLVVLVSCVSRKRESAASAKDLYESTWFVLARRFVEARNVPWFILSAKYGLVEPDAVIEPYDETLNTFGVAQRRAWSERVQVQMETMLPPSDKILVLAGSRYREFLMDYLRTRARSVDAPMEGLRIGEQLQWLGNAATG